MPTQPSPPDRSSPTVIRLMVGNIVPKGDARDSEDVLRVWQAAGLHLRERTFRVENPQTGGLCSFVATLDVAAVLDRLQQARTQTGSLDTYRGRHANQPSLPIDGVLTLVLAAGETDPAPTDHLIHHTASVFFQQLLLGINLSWPGACQLLSCQFAGPGAHRYEAQNFDSRAFHDGRCSSLEHGWPLLRALPFATVWDWMDRAATSQRNTAITSLNKVLIDLLKIARQRDHYGARTALLVANQLELLLGTQADRDMVHARERAGLILGVPPESADCFKELYRLKEALITGAHPVRRPALVYHHAEEETIDQIKHHNSGIEKGFAVLIALLQHLISHDAQGFEFRESAGLVPLRSA